MELSLLNLLFVLLAGWLAGAVAARVKYPSVLGELVAGMVLGPPLLGLLYGSPALDVLAEVGVLLMMLYIGMEIDPRELFKARWAGVLAALGGFITPFVLAYVIVVAFGGSPLAAAFVGIAAGVTSLATKSRILVDLKILDTRVAHVMLAGALISDTLSLVVFAAIMGAVDVGGVDLVGTGIVALKALLFFGATAIVGLKVFPWLGQRLTRVGLTGRTFNFTLVLLLAVVFGEAAELAGLHAILGTFIAGLFIRENVLGKTLSQDLMGAVRDASIGFLAPIFFVTIGFLVSFDVFRTDLALLAAIIVAATLGKVLGTALFYLPSGHGWREGMAVGMGMNGRGAVEIIIAGIGLERGLISQEIFSILVFMALFTTATVPVLLKWGTDWLRRRGELVRSREERRGTLIVGAGPLARRLGGTLAEARPVWMVDSNAERCALARRQGLTVVRGNALEEQILSEASAPAADSMAVMTTNAEVNALAAQLGKNVFMVPGVHVLQVADDDEEDGVTLRHLEATALFGTAVDVSEWDHRLAHDEVVGTELEIERSMPARALAARLREEDTEALALAVERGDDRFPFHSGLPLRAGDRVHLLRVRAPIERDRFDRLVADAPVLDFDEPVTADEFLRRAGVELARSMGADQQTVVRGLLEREGSGSTVLAPGLAIPHVRLEGAGRFGLLIARCRPGISFPGQREPVHASLVLAGSADERNFQLRALSAIAQIMQDPDFFRKWRTAAGPDDLRRLILRADRRRYAEPSPA